MGWRLQKVRTKRGRYTQAVHYANGVRRTVGLGYLDDEEAKDALVALREGGDRLLVFTNREIKTYALDPNRKIVSQIFREFKDFSTMTFREFVEEEFEPVRVGDVAESTWDREPAPAKAST